MFVDADPAQARAILRAMADVARVRGEPMTVVDGRIDEDKIAGVLHDAEVLGVHGGYLRELAEAARHELQQVAACMTRLNQVSITGRPPTDDYMAWIMPYRDGHEDGRLVQRFAELASLPPGTFGRG